MPLKKEIYKKICKVKKINIEGETYEELQDKYKTKELSYRELYILNGVLSNRNKSELARELGICLATVYNTTACPQFQKVFKEEIQNSYELMKRTRKAMYTMIAKKGLNLLLYRLERIEREELENEEGSLEKTKDILFILEKTVNLMQEEDGLKRLGIDISGGLQNTNLNANATIKEFDIADKYFRNNMANFLVKSKGKSDITRVVD